MTDFSGHDANNTDTWWRGAVIYQIYPRSFCDANQDGIGDLQGIISKLDYIHSLNVDAIWISPFFTSPMKDFGYDVSNYREVDPIFGQLDDFKELLRQAHARNIKVIIDQVLSHTSDQHPWFVESRQDKNNAKADWYVWQDPLGDGTPPTNWQSVFGGSSWQWDSRRQQYYLHNFLVSQPDLNFHNPEVQQQMLEEMQFWLDLGVDGFRLDTVNYYFHDDQLRNNPGLRQDRRKLFNPYDFQSHLYDKNRPQSIAYTQRMRHLLNQYQARMLMGEIGDKNAEKMMQDYTGGQNKLHTAYSFRLLNEEFGAQYFADVIAQQETLLTDGWPSWAFSNHDITRVLSRWGDRFEQQDKLVKTLLAFLFCLRGSVCLYQGEELGLPEATLTFEQLQDPWGITFWPEFKGRDGCRTPMPWDSNAPNAGFTDASPWLPVAQSHYPLAVQTQTQAPDSTLNFTRQFLAFRKTQAALICGDIHQINADGELLSFRRVDDTMVLQCLFWFSDQPRQITKTGNILSQSDTLVIENDQLTFKGPGYVIFQETPVQPADTQ
ncbi:alpha-amylase family glycosyl hydrolase [Planctobacterium marinum]|uniref:alpha-amylase family glycosyl hydrolase n=1 Tax=Planctobacterium marinum TaxID=1631968 RepID=UPI001E2B5398|nr:alpha-amylase family glycosyl hydrolase [Planctobacterium marinum]MCC2606338.1 alpha-glucosidase [Planctobacterium marinum]